MALFQKQDRSHMIGQKIGTWTVLAEYPVPKKKNWMMLCRCECGTEKPVMGCLLLSGKTKGCKRCQWKRVCNIKVGKRYKKWTVLSYGGMRGKTSGYICRCECGQEVWVPSSNLSRGTSGGCRRCFIERRRINRRGDWWKSLVKQAEERGLPVEVTREYLFSLFESQDRCCALSGVKLVLYSQKGRDFVRRTASVDRKDSTKGYIVGNVQWVHSRINIMKGALADDDFIRLCRRVAKHNNSKTENREQPGAECYLYGRDRGYAGHTVVPTRGG